MGHQVGLVPTHCLGGQLLLTVAPPCGDQRWLLGELREPCGTQDVPSPLLFTLALALIVGLLVLLSQEVHTG